MTSILSHFGIRTLTKSTGDTYSFCPAPQKKVQDSSSGYLLPSLQEIGINVISSLVTVQLILDHIALVCVIKLLEDIY